MNCTVVLSFVFYLLRLDLTSVKAGPSRTAISLNRDLPRGFTPSCMTRTDNVVDLHQHLLDLLIIPYQLMKFYTLNENTEL
jgi:hypothetical protein